jgi:polyribonucleotide nucleotidyltransferase
VEIAATNKESIDMAVRAVKAIVAIPEVGETYEGKISSVMPYGAFIEFMPGKDGLLHISEMDWKRLETVEESGFAEGDTIIVKLIDVDPKTGKFKLSRRTLLPKPEGFQEAPPRPPRGGSGGSSHGSGGDRFNSGHGDRNRDSHGGDRNRDRD